MKNNKTSVILINFIEMELNHMEKQAVFWRKNGLIPNHRWEKHREDLKLELQQAIEKLDKK